MMPGEPMGEMHHDELESDVEQLPLNPSEELVEKLAPFVDGANRRVDREIEEGSGKVGTRAAQAISWLENNHRLQRENNLTGIGFTTGELGESGQFYLDNTTGGIVRIQESPDGKLELAVCPPATAPINGNDSTFLKQFRSTLSARYPKSTKSWHHLSQRA